MLHHLPREVVITIAVIVFVFGIGLLFMCCLLRASSSGGSTIITDRHEPDEDEESSSRRFCGCCLCCKSDRASRAAHRRQFSSFHALLYEIDEDETARIVVAAPGRVGDPRGDEQEDGHDNEDHRSSSMTANHVIDVSMDLLFPDILSVPKDSAVQQPQNASAGSGTGLDEPLL
jgi:hypothetical protein